MNEILSDKDNTTLNLELRKKVHTSFDKIELFFHNQRYWLTEQELPFVIGRENSSCHLVVNSDTTSRIHCVLCIKGGRIGLLDQSTNGTVIKSGQAESIIIHNEFLPLTGQGYIKPGANINLEDSYLIRFKVVLNT